MLPTSLFEIVGSQDIDASKGRDRGAGSRNRTHDQRFTKPLLYQLSYAGLSEILLAQKPLQATIERKARPSTRQTQRTKSTAIGAVALVTDGGLHELPREHAAENGLRTLKKKCSCHGARDTRISRRQLRGPTRAASG
jgi:hypothetical protein